MGLITDLVDWFHVIIIINNIIIIIIIFVIVIIMLKIFDVVLGKVVARICISAFVYGRHGFYVAKLF